MIRTASRHFWVSGLVHRPLWFAVAIAAAVCGLAVGARYIGRLRAEARQGQGMGRMARIGLAIHNYRADKGGFPPICIRDSDGRPLHSWRVLILPYCELGDVYSRYDFNEAWDGPHNSALAEEVSERVAPIFRCPNDAPENPRWTTFVAVTTESANNPEHLVVNLGATISASPAIVELHKSGIQWMEPRDLPVADARAALARGAARSDAAYYLADDGRIWTLSGGQLIHRNSNDEIIDGLFKRQPAER
jgi:Protein of unknown function (DUF1559)